MSRKFELAKVRDFGEIINDTFVFLKQNFKQLMKHIFTFAGIFLAGTIVCSTIYQLQIQSNFNGSIAPANSNIYNVSSSEIYFFVAIIFDVFFVAFTNIITLIVVISYLALYKIKGGVPPTTEEVWGYLKYYFWRVLGAAFVTGLLYCVGAVFCLVPGIYLITVLSLFAPIIIIENGSFSYSFSRCFTLIKDNWWVSFGVMVVMLIIVAIASSVMGLPSNILLVIFPLAHITLDGPIAIALTAFAMSLRWLGSLMMIIPMISVGLIYFNLVESKEGTTLLDRIDAIGTAAATEPDETEDAGEEEY